MCKSPGKQKVNPVLNTFIKPLVLYLYIFSLFCFFFACSLGLNPLVMVFHYWLLTSQLESWFESVRGSCGQRPLGVPSSVCALLSDNNPNHFSPMLSPPARSGRYTTSAVFASQQLHLIGFSFLFLSCFFLVTVVAVWQVLILCPCLHFVWIFHVCIIWAILHL